MLISFSYERMSAKTRFEEEAKGNSEIAKDLIVRTFACDIRGTYYRGERKRRYYYTMTEETYSVTSVTNTSPLFNFKL